MNGWEKTIDTIAAHKITEVVHFHDECYGTYTHYAPAFGIDVPFKSIHLFEFLYNRLMELKENIKPLNLKVAYQRPCSSRLSSDKYTFVDKIFNLVGVDHVEREFIGKTPSAAGAPSWDRRKKEADAWPLNCSKKT